MYEYFYYNNDFKKITKLQLLLFNLGFQSKNEFKLSIKISFK